MKKIAFVFPGQGSQTVGMLEAWQDNSAVQQALATANTALDQDLAHLIATGPEADLNLTTNTQPAMLVSAVGMYQAWREAGGQQPDFMAGHSLGEYSALTAAGSLHLDDAVKLVRIRANAMQEAVPVGTGTMAALLGLEDDIVREVCREAAQGEAVEAVNFNAPLQVVIAGQVAAVERACELAKAKGARRAVVLPVSAPFHSSLLQPAAEVLERALQQLELNVPVVPVINNVDVAVATEPDAIRSALVRQAWHPVRWVETIQYMAQQGVTDIVECGPGKVLAGLIKRIDRQLSVHNIHDPVSLQQALTALKG